MLAKRAQHQHRRDASESDGLERFPDNDNADDGYSRLAGLSDIENEDGKRGGDAGEEGDEINGEEEVEEEVGKPAGIDDDDDGFGLDDAPGDDAPGDEILVSI